MSAISFVSLQDVDIVRAEFRELSKSVTALLIYQCWVWRASSFCYEFLFYVDEEGALSSSWSIMPLHFAHQRIVCFFFNEF